MLQQNRQVWQYGFGVLALVAGYLSAFFILWPFARLQEMMPVFNSERTWMQITVTFSVTASVFYFAQISLLALLLFSLYMVYRLRSGTPLFTGKTLAFFLKKPAKIWHTLPAWEKKLALFMLVLLVLARLYFLQLFRVGFDEACTYILFLSKGWPGVLTYYPVPNNHVLYNLLCLPLLALFNDPFYVLKLPALIISIGSLMVFYLGLRSVFRFPVVFIATVGSGLSYYALYYAVNGRAYSLMLLCTGLAALALLKIYEQQENRYWLVFMLASIAGFFAVPVFLYPFAGMVFFGAFSFFLTRNRSGFFNLVLATFFAGVATLLLYLPIMLVSGPEQLFGNEYVVRLSREVFLQKLPVYLPYTQGAVLGQETVGFYGWLAAVLLLSLLLLFRKRLRNFWQENGLTPGRVFWVWCGSIIPWLIMLVQGVLPPDRVWLFKAFFDFLLLGIAAQATIGLVLRAQPTWWFSAAVLLTLVYGSYEVIKLRRSVQGNTILDGPFDRNIERIRQGGAKTVASSEGFYAAFLRYHYLQHGQENLIIDEVDQLSGQPYDVVILEPNHLFPEALDQADYELMHQDQFVRIFRRKPGTKD